jgi:hypothetical protein
VWQLLDGFCYRGQKWKLNPVRPIPSVIQKEKCISWKLADEIYNLDCREMTADDRNSIKTFENHKINTFITSFRESKNTTASKSALHLIYPRKIDLMM